MADRRYTIPPDLNTVIFNNPEENTRYLVKNYQQVEAIWRFLNQARPLCSITPAYIDDSVKVNVVEYAGDRCAWFRYRVGAKGWEDFLTITTYTGARVTKLIFKWDGCTPNQQMLLMSLVAKIAAENSTVVDPKVVALGEWLNTVNLGDPGSMTVERLQAKWAKVL